MLLPLALAQFVCSYAASNMNVAISDIARDLSTDVSGVQVAITIFTLTMAALMIPGSKLTDIWGRKRCFMLGLAIYGIGAVIAALAQGLPTLIIGYSFFEGIGSALLIPPVYILATLFFTNIKERAKAFGIISAMGGIGAASGPLIGGFITTAFSWRASFIAQALLVAGIIYLGRQMPDIARTEKMPVFDIWGAILAAVGLFAVVVGILQIKTYGLLTATQDFSIGGQVILPEGSISPVILFIGFGLAILLWFYLHIRRRERIGEEPLLSTALFKNKTSNLGLLTQLSQWFVLLGSSFVLSVFFQEVKGYSAIATGLALTPTTIGLLLSSLRAQRMATRFSQRTLITTGFAITVLGLVLTLIAGLLTTSYWVFVIPLFVFGFGAGIMLTASVNVVQSSFPEKDQGEISGLSRSVSNLGSSLGTAIAGTVLVATVASASQTYAYALITVIVAGLAGLFAAFFLPNEMHKTAV
jgi:MFS family permease